MVLLNASSAARNAGSLITQNSGGGDKKMGLVYQIGRDSWTSIALNERSMQGTLLQFRTTLYPNTRQSRPIGSVGIVSRYGPMY